MTAVLMRFLPACNREKQTVQSYDPSLSHKVAEEKGLLCYNEMEYDQNLITGRTALRLARPYGIAITRLAASPLVTSPLAH